MSITLLSPGPVLSPDPVRSASRADRPGEPGLVALALGLLALASSVHPLWVLPAVGFALAGTAAGLRALLHRGERRWAAAGLAAAVLALAVLPFTLTATVEAALGLLGALGDLRSTGAR